MTIGPTDIKCHICEEKIDGNEVFYKVQFTQHKRNEVLAEGIRLRPYILCVLCATEGMRNTGHDLPRKEAQYATP